MSGDNDRDNVNRRDRGRAPHKRDYSPNETEDDFNSNQNFNHRRHVQNNSQNQSRFNSSSNELSNEFDNFSQNSSFYNNQNDDGIDMSDLDYPINETETMNPISHEQGQMTSYEANQRDNNYNMFNNRVRGSRGRVQGSRGNRGQGYNNMNNNNGGRRFQNDQNCQIFNNEQNFMVGQNFHGQKRSFSNNNNRGGNHSDSPKSSHKKTAHHQQNNRDTNFEEKNKFRHETEDISLYSNFFEMINLIDNWELHHYNVDFEPEIMSKRLKSGLVHACIEVFKGSLIFDGSCAFSLTKLPDQVTEHSITRKSDSQSIKLTITYVDLVDKNSKEYYRINNIILRSASTASGFFELGKERTLYDFNNKIDFRSNILIIPGYSSTFNYFENKCLLRVNISHKAISSKSVLDMMEDILFRNGYDRAKVEAELIGKQILTNYNKLVYKIEAIDWESKPTDSFERSKDKAQLRFCDFYRSNYNIVIQDLNQPLLDCSPIIRKGQSKNVKIIPELCATSGESLLAPFKTDVLFSKEYNKQSNLDPTLRYAKIKSFITKIKAKNKMLDTWKMDFPTDVVQVPAKLLKSVDIYFANQVKYEQTEWSNSFRTASFIKYIPLKNWFLVYTDQDKYKARLLEEKIIGLGTVMNFPMNQPRKIELNADHNLVLNMTSRVKQIAETNKPQMILYLIPKSNDVLYKAIKRTCCIDLAIPSQVITSKVIDPNNQGKLSSILTKVVAQMNCKLGGELWGVKFKGKKTMVIGMDTWREGKNSSSVGAFVASLNGRNDEMSFTKWYSQAMVYHDHNNKFYSNLNVFMCNALRKYYELNEYLPTTIVCYRDGVVDDEHEIVLSEEISQIKTAFKTCYTKEEEQPCLIFIILKKRIRARFFEKSNASNDENYSNPKIGTVIDSKVIKQKEREFYLISQSVRQGTVNPTQYFVLLNEREPLIKLNNIQTLTFLLTHMYYNWPSQIRVPAPCHYAYKLASLVGESLLNSNFKNSPDLQDKLYYL